MKSGLWRVLQGTTLAIIAELLSRMSNTIFFILLTWKNTQVEASTFSIGFVYTGLLMAFCLGGLDQLLNRDASHDITGSRVTLGNFMLARGLTAICIYGGLCLWLVAYSSYDSHELLVIILLGSTIISESLNNLFQAFFIAANRIQYIVILNTLVGLIRIFWGATVILLDGNSIAVAVIVVLTSWIGSLIAFLIIGWQFFWPHVILERKLWKQYFYAEMPLLLMAIMASLDGHFDALLLTSGGSNDIVVVGTYNAAVALLNALLIIPNTLRQVVLSALSSVYYKNRKFSLFLYRNFMRAMFYFALYCCLSVYFLAPQMISFIYKQSFVTSVPVLQTMIWSFLWIMLLVPNGRLMLTASIQHRAVLPQLAGTLLNVSLNLILQPVFGLVGAAMTKVCSSALVFWWCFWIVRREIYRMPVWPVIWPAVAASMVTVAFFVLNSWWHLFWAVEAVAGAILYFLALYGFGGIKRTELQAFRRLLPLRQHGIIGGK